jgi:integrase
MGRLTALGVQRNNKPGLYLDGHGLILQVRGPASKSWLFRYRMNGRVREMGLGPLHTINLGEARELALQARKLKLAGIDPIEERRERRQSAEQEAAPKPTFDQCVEQYLALHQPSWSNSKHQAQWTSTLKTYASPHFGQMAVCDVDLAAVLSALEPIWLTKSETASRLRGRIETVLDWAKVRGLRSGDNPATWKGNLARVLPARSRVRQVKHHAAMPFSEASAFMAELQKRDGMAALALQFLVLTAARTGEVLLANWEEFRLDDKLWVIPAQRMKAKREHRVPLTQAALEILRRAKVANASSRLVFPSAVPDRGLSSAAMAAVLKRTGHGHLTVHGFRSAFRDWAAEKTNHPSEVVEMALAHTIGNKVEAAYRRGDLFEKRRSLMNDWSTFLKPTTRA